ncbi:DUF402 domain-containing protein [Corynebacterium uberis]|uniref:DUF402 domain-containing protein n=1 Tax=Corynebacterium TaxID=1716 RepID=UPI001D0A6B26|nr:MULTISPECIES: DUF402 domain-containing protein [Corynebacterium]MCZ9308938.1 DUF402 domain-containing protein [Corynebacterium sp. c6VSa_13]UDL74591.1 DUF402 domain-containing protein [Corynebacterium uberis]UDL76575.1 DUF402 domain-containing protein [Corynebacterium uberis]UDL78788.1 DUF402 domain-containing protein [Corynebacterium uberis]UDL81066.1 DUF402 domain-containing protein [Corynebacterium uberis]
MGKLHAIKRETFDVSRAINIDPKGFERAVDTYREAAWGLYMARGANHPRFGYLESWLLPELDLRVNIFHHRAPRPFEYYIDVAAITRTAQVWHTRDLYVDLICVPGQPVTVDDLDELSDALAAGLISPEEGTRALKATTRAIDGIARCGDDPMAWLSSLGVELEWARPENLELTPAD